MNFRSLAIFTAVCEEKNMTAAARRLHLAQPSVSLAIRELETEYDCVFFERLSKRLYLTEAGQRFYAYAQRILALQEEMDVCFHERTYERQLRIGSSITIATRFLPEYVRQFRELYPQMQVKVAVDNTDTIARMVLDNQIDLGLVEGPVDSSCLLSRPCGGDELVMVCSPHHPYASYRSVAPEVLAVEEVLLREKGSAGRDLFDSLMESRGFRIEPAWQSVSTQALVGAVKADLGVAVLPYYLVQEAIQRGEVMAVPLEGVNFRRRYNVILHRNKFHSVALDAFLSLCRSLGDMPAVTVEPGQAPPIETISAPL